MEEELSPLERDLSLTVVLQGGLEETTTVHGSKPVMDLLVTLCANYRLNPSDYTVEFLSQNKNTITFKPNSPIGSLDAEKIVLRPKAVEEKSSRPYMPEASVRLLINYSKAHKTVVRVNPKLPLESLLPLVCDKCEFNLETTVLLKDVQSVEPLDLTKTLSDLGLREVYAKDTAAGALEDLEPKMAEPVETPTDVLSSTPQQKVPTPKKSNNRKEKNGFLGLFRRKKKTMEMTSVASPPTSPGLQKHAKELDVPSSCTPAADMHKKRPAPPPPVAPSISCPHDMTTCHLNGGPKSADCTLRSTKRRAPPPPCGSSQPEQPDEATAEGDEDLIEDLKESDESGSLILSRSSSSSPPTSVSSSSSASQSVTHLAPFQSKDLTEAHHALAKVLNSSVSKGALVQHLRNSSIKYSSSTNPYGERVEGGGDFRGELESVLKSKLHSENEWEEPAWKKGVNTFKVLPKMTKTTVESPENDPEPCPSPPPNDTPQGSPPPEGEDSEHETDQKHECENDSLNPIADQCCSEVEVETQVSQEVDVEVEDAFGDGSEEDLAPPVEEEERLQIDPESAPEAEEKVEDEDFPPPPPPVFYNDDVPVKEERDQTAATPAPVAPTSNCHLLTEQTDNDTPAPEPPEKTLSAPTRFAQAVALAVQRSRRNSCANDKLAEGLAGFNGGLS